MKTLTETEQASLYEYLVSGSCCAEVLERLTKLGCVDKDSGRVTEYGHRVIIGDVE